MNGLKRNFFVIAAVLAVSGCISSQNYDVGVGHADLDDAKELTGHNLRKIIGNLPKNSKFENYRDLYAKYINSLGVFYSDTKLLNWNIAASAYEIDPIVFEKSESRNTQYQAVNGFGVSFTVSETRSSNDVIYLGRHQLQPKSIDEAKKLDRKTVRVYFKLVPAVSVSDGFFPTFENIYGSSDVCKLHVSSIPTIDSPYDRKNNGCELYAIIVKGVILREGIEIFPRMDYEKSINEIQFK